MSENMEPKMGIQTILSNIKKIRELKNITREHMASDLEMTASGYSKIERGENELSVFRLLQIAMTLNVSVSQIMSFDVSTIFSESDIQQGTGLERINNHTSDNYLEKYIQKLEEEIQRLKQERT
jgi:transcriptional regulator with XRE-family HTH domain